MAEIKSPRKLIEVALPLDAINIASAREKSIRHGHPSTMHSWWARRPLAAARAVLFTQLVNDPGYERSLGRGVNKEKAQIERDRLFGILKRLVLWENTNNREVLREAREEIWKSWRETCSLNKDHPEAKTLFNPEVLPPFHDPFAGGGAIPFEAQRLGLESTASDLNPVAVLINKAMIEIPASFVGQAPVGPRLDTEKQASLSNDWSGSAGLAQDIKRYGALLGTKAKEKLGPFYPDVEITSAMVKERKDLSPLVGKKLPVLAWLWARTIKSPNPAFSHVDVPLAASFVLSSIEGRENYIEPVCSGSDYKLVVRVGKGSGWANAENGTKLSHGANFRCLLSGAPMEPKYIKAEACAGRMGAKLLALVADGPNGRIFLSPDTQFENVTAERQPAWEPDTKLSGSTQYLGVLPYGMNSFRDLFTLRQLHTLGTFAELVQEIQERAKKDALTAGMKDDQVSLEKDGRGATAYSDAIAVYLALAVSKESVFLNTQSRWRSGESKSAPAFGRQAIPMVWDYAEINPFAGAGGDFTGIVDGIAKSVLSGVPTVAGKSFQQDATTQSISLGKVVSTDPPYYDNVPYADLSDFFYVWLRRILQPTLPILFDKAATPKEEELTRIARSAIQ